MLKAIVQQMKLRSEPGFRKLPSLIPILANDHGHLQLARKQQWFVPELLRQSSWVHKQNAP